MANRQLAGLRVLLAEDMAVNRELVAVMLGQEGVRLTTVEDGSAAVRAAMGQVFDVILMDMRMPVMDGTEAAQRIRAGRGLNTRTPIIGLTGNVSRLYIDAWMTAGLNGHVAKPFDTAALTRSIREALCRIK